MNRIQIASRAAQSGIALITGLIFLVLLTIIGVTAMQTTMLEERMAGNLRDENLAFQAAEAALRAGESYLQGATLVLSLPLKIRQVCINQRCLRLRSGGRHWTSGPRLARGPIPARCRGVTTPPRYIIEDLSFRTQCTQPGFCQNIPLPKTPGGSQKFGAVQDVGLYRITARGTGGSNDTAIVLQSYFRR